MAVIVTQNEEGLVRRIVSDVLRKLASGLGSVPDPVDLPDGALLVGEFTKIDEERQLVFGWAYVAKDEDGEQVIDHSGDFVDDIAGLEDAVYEYVLKSREGDTMHDGAPTATLVESLAITPEKLEQMGLAKDALPLGWWVGFHIEDDETWAKVKKGDLRMFSISGRGVRQEVRNAA